MNGRRRQAATATTTLVARFNSNATAVGTHVMHAHGDDDLARSIDELANGGRASIAPALAAERPGLLDALRARGVTLAMPDVADPAASFEAVTVGVSRADLGLAETGSLVVADELPDRLVRMLAPKHVALLDVTAIVPGLDEAGAFLNERLARRDGSAGRYVSFITGPSRTADIEMSLTVGAHGPAELHIALFSAPPRPASDTEGGVAP